MKTSNELWYDKWAEDWNEALPVGNGRIGGMVYGNPYYDIISLNEDSIWSGGYRKRNNMTALENLQKVRDLLFEEKISEAEEIVHDAFCGTPVNQRHYMPLGDFIIEQRGLGDINSFKRKLDLERAVSSVEFSSNGINYTREVIASYPDNVLAVNIKADKKGSINIRIHIDGRDDYFDDNSPVSDDEIFYYGGMGGEDGINFASYIKIITVSGEAKRWGSFIKADGCDEVTILISCQTSYRFEDYKKEAERDIEKALRFSFAELRERHIEDYKRYYDRVKLELYDNSKGKAELPTDERLANLQSGGKDNKLTELYYNFARYLMIAGSREGTLPLNLQGIWNKDMWPAWGCKFTININTEMNYWPVESAGLSELVTPLFDLIEKMRPNGRITAKEMYGCSGFVCHHNTDLWGDTAPQDLWMPGTQWPMGAAWLCLHIWEHYMFTKDKDFLKEKYGTIKEASEFFVDFLIENKNGQLVTCPSVSPENTYLTESGQKGSLCIGPSMDSQIIYELFTAVINASEILGVDSDYAEMLKTMREKLPKPEIGKYGQIKEWAIDYDEVEPGHRHISQLFALYPADMISVRKTPKLADAARATLERRLSHGGGHTGWSRAWIINLWARLNDGEKVYENITALLSYSTNKNMLDNHPPFQIDGNFGGAAGISEALLQSINQELILLPALPDEWKSGSFENLRARGGFTVSCKWENRELQSALIISNSGEVCRLVTNTTVKVYCDGAEVCCEQKDGAIVFNTCAGKVYEIKAVSKSEK